MARTRSRVVDIRHSFSNGQEYVYSDYPREHFIEQYYPGSTPCYHWASALGQGSAVQTDGIRQTLSNHPIHTVAFGQVSGKANNFAGILDSSKLPTNTDVAIIQTIAELDESLLLFTKNFWRQVNYGSFTWGVLPFVGELQALLKLVLSLEKLMGNADYETSNTLTIPDFSVGAFGSSEGVVRNCKTTIRHTGKVNMADLGAAKWLDAFGYYPDLATVWDLVPLSFAVNWILPVGSFLESFRTGWLTHVPFTGWVTQHTTFDYEYRALAPNFVPSTWFRIPGEVFTRSFESRVLEVPSHNRISSLELPSLTELFNLFYLSIGNRLETEVDGRLRGGRLRPNGTRAKFSGLPTGFKRK